MCNAIETHQPCPDCGSSDALTINDDGSTKCYSCGVFTPGNGKKVSASPKEKKIMDIYYGGEIVAIKSRGVSEETAKKYGVKTDIKGNISYPLYDKNGNLVATKARKGGKKDFIYTGEPRKAVLFGMNSFGDGGKYLTITEGQDDAMAAFEMMGSKYPVISINSAGTAAKDVKQNLDYIESFENIVLVFDNDEAGNKAREEVAEVLSANKTKYVQLTKYKDANDYLMAGDEREFVNEWWQQKTLSPVGVVSGEDAWESLIAKRTQKVIPIPKSMPELSAKLNGGIVRGEITTIGALTSVGKSTFINNFVYGFLKESNVKVGYLGLEASVGDVIGAMIDLELGYKATDTLSDEELKEQYKKMSFLEQLKVVDHRGSLELDSLTKRIRNIIVSFDLDVFILDPLQQALQNLENDTVKQVMDALLKIASSTGVSFVVVSHMRKPSEKDPHNVTEYDLLGSSAINQVSFTTVLLSRDKMSEDERVRNCVKLHLPKSRRTGDTGSAGWLWYNKNTLKLEYTTNPYEEDSDGVIEDNEWRIE